MPEDVLVMALTCCNVQQTPNDNIDAMLRRALEMDLSRLDKIPRICDVSSSDNERFQKEQEIS